MLEIRKATINDIDFVIAAIIEAEKSGTGYTLYQKLFGLTGDELSSLLRMMLLEEIPGSELCCDSFFICFANEAPVGCIASWIEGEGVQASNFVRANLLAYAIGAKRWAEAQSSMRILGEVEIVREPGTIQIESVYVSRAYRGKRIAATIIEHALSYWNANAPDIKKAQILSVIENEAAVRTFSGVGFVVTRRAQSTDVQLKSIFPGTGRFLWERGLRS
jgi:ribosomal protein S18 acetylase RimI-like enzyme